MLGDTKVVGDDDMAGLSEDVQSLVRKELAYIISSENAMYPVAAEGGTSTLRKRKRPPALEEADQALAKDSEKFIVARDALAYIKKAKTMVSEQMSIDFSDARVSKADMASIFEGLETVKRRKEREAKVNWLPFSRNCKELFGTKAEK